MTLADLPVGGEGILAELQVEPDVASRLMELGFVPGTVIRTVRTAPGGDPIVFRVDGSEVALRAETARHLSLRASP